MSAQAHRRLSCGACSWPVVCREASPLTVFYLVCVWWCCLCCFLISLVVVGPSCIAMAGSCSTAAGCLGCSSGGLVGFNGLCCGFLLGCHPLDPTAVSAAWHLCPPADVEGATTLLLWLLVRLALLHRRAALRALGDLFSCV